MAVDNAVAEKLMNENAENAARIVAVVERHLGKGKKVADCTERQAEIVELITEELKSL